MRSNLPPPPPGCGISGKTAAEKRTMRCTKHDSEGNQCTREIRFSSTPPPHKGMLQKNESEPQQLLIDP
jgi:hypothetical protein